MASGKQRIQVSHPPVEGIRVGRFNVAINTTCILYRIGTTVIDTGPPHAWKKVRSFLREKEIRQVLLTHHHEDHGGNSLRIQKEFNIPIYIHSQGIELCQKWDSMPLIQHIIWGKPKAFEALPLPDRIEVDSRYTLQPIFSPGHTTDMVCFLEEQEGWLFTGDLFITRRPSYMRYDESASLQMESLRRVLRHSFQTVFCSHRGVLENGKALLMDRLNYLEIIQDRARDFHQQGIPLHEISRRILGKEGSFHWISQKSFSKQNLIRTLLPKTDLVISKSE